VPAKLMLLLLLLLVVMMTVMHSDGRALRCSRVHTKRYYLAHFTHLQAEAARSTSLGGKRRLRVVIVTRTRCVVVHGDIIAVSGYSERTRCWLLDSTSSVNRTINAAFIPCGHERALMLTCDVI